ncbi:MAG: F0F1 ATP synthase subunit delta [Bacilli bacterium]|nr:F0F1 ATP synthase subunit delta [Bacilli bacterium]
MNKDRYANYAQALLSFAKEENDVQGYKNDVLYVSNVLDENKELVEFLSSMSVSETGINSVIDSVFGNLKSKHLCSFLKLLSAKHISRHYDKIFSAFISLSNAELGVKEGIIYSVDEMSSDDIKKIEESLSKRLESKVYLENRIDHDLIGGYKISIDGKVYDSSVVSKLNRLKAVLYKTEGGK